MEKREQRQMHDARGGGKWQNERKRLRENGQGRTGTA